MSHDVTKEMTVEQAIRHLCNSVPRLATGRSVAPGQAIARVLARDLASPLDLPAFDNSAMDGYAVRHADLAAGRILREVGHSYAGHGFVGRVEPGACVRIMTGAPMPDGADTVVVLENVDVADGKVTIGALPAAGANVRRKGEHVTRGDIALRAGTLLSAAEVALVASVGVARLRVLRRLRVGLLSTGDELADPPQPLVPAGSYDANRPLLHAASTRLGFEAIDLGICRDSGAAFGGAMDRAFDAHCDAIVISGGAAQGDADIVRQAGGVQFVPLNIRPGRGLAHARLRRGEAELTLLGLPGNVVAAFVMFHLVARSVLLHMAGAQVRPLPRLRAPLAVAATTRGGRVDYRRGRLAADGSVCLLRDQGSAMLRTLVEADCLVVLGPQDHHDAGAAVEVIPLGLFA